MSILDRYLLRELFQGLFGLAGAHQLHQLDLFELVLAQHARGILAGTAGLAAKTGCVTNHLDRHTVGDLVAHYVA